MKTYETVFIVPSDMAPQRVEDITEKVKSLITKSGGEILLVDKWSRRLAYPIRHHREGVYVFIQFKGPETFLAELNQFYRVSEEIIRQLTCKSIKGKPASPMMTLPVPGAAIATVVPAVPAPKEEVHEQSPSPAPAQ